MRRLREKLAQANLKLGRNYPEPKLSYTQRGNLRRNSLAGKL